jgi:hypothetical protein
MQGSSAFESSACGLFALRDIGAFVVDDDRAVVCSESVFAWPLALSAESKQVSSNITCSLGCESSGLVAVWFRFGTFCG